MNWGWWPHPSWSNAQSTSLIKSGNDVEQKRHISLFDKRSRANKWEVELKANHAFGQLWCTPFICFPEVLTNYLVADMKKAHTHTHKWHFCFLCSLYFTSPSFFSFRWFLHEKQTESVLMYDTVHVFAVGLQTLEQSHIWRSSNMSCADEKPWDGGLSLINYINAVRICWNI